ncbi:hypothetical protein L9F63_010027, partial [Diploptera punctata]
VIFTPSSQRSPAFALKTTLNPNVFASKDFLRTEKSVHAIVIVEIPKLPGEVTLQRTNREQPDGNRR